MLRSALAEPVLSTESYLSFDQVAAVERAVAPLMGSSQIVEIVVSAVHYSVDMVNRRVSIIVRARVRVGWKQADLADVLVAVEDDLAVLAVAWRSAVQYRLFDGECRGYPLALLAPWTPTVVGAAVTVHQGPPARLV